MKRLVLACAALGLVACGSSSPTTPTPAAPTTVVFTASLSAANEAPPITNADADGRGTATITLTLTRDGAGAITAATANFVYNLSGFPAGTTVRAAHIHEGAAGIAGGIYVDTGLTAAAAITLADGTGANLTFNGVSVPADRAQAIITNPASYYFNVHTAVNPGGAVRGQLVKQ